MNKNTLKKIKRICDELWQKFSLEPGFDIEKLVKNLNIKFESRDLNGKASGLFINSLGSKLIIVNKSDSLERRSYSTAHELGHYFLHSSEDIVVDNFITIRKRDENSSLGKFREEVEANRFAAELLMPENIIASNINTQASFEENVNYLRGIFKVSTTAMTIRLERLGYIY